MIAAQTAGEAASGVPNEGWDTDLQSLGGHVLQSRAWARCQQRLGVTTFHQRGDGWLWLGVVRKVGPFASLYLPYGPMLAGAGLDHAVRAAALCARQAACSFVQIEPVGPAPLHPERLGARRAPMRNPTYTWVLRLDVDESTLRSGLTKGHRGSINAAPRRGIVVSQRTDDAAVEDFLRLLRLTQQRTSMSLLPDSYYRAILDELMPTNDAVLYVATAQERAVAAAVGLDFGSTRYYVYAGTDPAARGLSPSAPLVWQMILDARASGKRWFDFWGVSPPGATDHWSGFSQFKRSFGGELAEHGGTWDLPVRPLAYSAWRVARTLRPLASRARA